MVKIVCHGGVKTIGGNAIILEDKGTRFVIDIGLNFAARDRFFHDFLVERGGSPLRDLYILGILPRIDGIYNENLLRPEGVEDALIKTIGKDWRERMKHVMDYWSLPLKPYRRGKGADAIFLSHVHADHINMLQYVHPSIPVYCSEISLRLIHLIEKVSSMVSDLTSVRVWEIEYKKSGSLFPNAPYKKSKDKMERKFIGLEKARQVEINGIKVTSIPMDHSVAGAVAYIFELSDGRRVMYTGDFRFHTPLFEGAYKAYHKDIRDIDILITEGTKVGLDEDNRGVEKTEDEVYNEIKEKIYGAEGLVCVSFMWKDLVRYATLRRIARDTGRVLVVNAKTAHMLNAIKEVATEEFDALGIRWPDDGVKIYIKRKMSMTYSPDDYTGQKYNVSYVDFGAENSWESIDFFGGIYDDGTHRIDDNGRGIRAYDIARKPEEYIVQMTEYDLNELLDLYPSTRGGTFIRASTGPLDEEMAFDEERLINWLRHFEFKEVPQRYYDPRDGWKVGHRPFYHSHSSGHASQRALFEFIDRINPSALIPIHTEHPEVFAEYFGDKCIIPKVDEPYEL